MRAIAWAAAASLALVIVYLALGGASYAPARVADPCAHRDWRDPKGVQEVAEQIVLSGLDGAACKLGVSREEMVLAFGSRDALESFAQKHHVSTQKVDELVRTGLMRSIDDAEQAGALNPTVGDLLRGFVRRFPVTALVELLQQLPGL
jgi:hypothetical protein